MENDSRRDAKGAPFIWVLFSLLVYGAYGYLSGSKVQVPVGAADVHSGDLLFLRDQVAGPAHRGGFENI